MKTPSFFRSLPAGAALFALAHLPLPAAPEAVDLVPFGAGSYQLGAQALVGQAPFLHGFTGPWLEAYNGAESPGVLGGSLSYPGLPTGGGSFHFPGSGAGRAGRLLAQPYDDASSTTVYLSVLIQLENVGGGYRAFELHSGGFDDNANRTLQIATGEPAGAGFDPTHFVVRVKDGDTVNSGDLGPGDSAVTLLVIRANLSSTPDADLVTVWINPDPSAEPGGGIVLSNFNFRFDRVSLARFGDDGIFFDEIRVGPTYADVTSFDHIADDDSDGDGLRDSWERAFSLDVGADDSALDPDGDTLSNADEFARFTNPTSDDSDGDTLTDQLETNRGTWVARSTDTGTDPLNPDSDGDGLSDGVENPDLPYDRNNPAAQPGTDPNLPDSDGDGESDGLEIANGTDPTDPASNSSSLGVIAIDGALDVTYGPALAVQTIQTGFGNNQSEWNAAYGKVLDGRLNLMFTGNLEANFNKLEIFLDALPGGSNSFPGLPGNDNSGLMTFMTFDAAFTPEFHVIARRGNSQFDLDFARLGTRSSDFYGGILNNGTSGSGTAGPGSANRTAIEVAYDGSNSAGIGGTAGAAADQGAALAVSTGLELSIALTDLGSPTGELRVMLLQNNQDHGFLSNQSLGGLPVGTGNLGNPSPVNFNNFAGDQFFTVPVAVAVPRLALAAGPLTNGVLSITVGEIPPGQTFHLRSSTDGESFAPLSPAIDFDSATPQPFSIPVTGPLRLIQAYEGPTP